MKKCLTFIFSVLFAALCLTSCAKGGTPSKTRFMFDTVIELDIECDSDTLGEAFSLCEKYEKMLSRTDKASELYALNHSSGFANVSAELKEIIEKSLEFCEISGGQFDITIGSITDLWDFNEGKIPLKDEVAPLLSKVDYKAVEISGNKINLNGTSLDLGAVAKGYIADKLKDFFYKKGIKDGVINLGGNVYNLSSKETEIGIANPDNPQAAITAVKVKAESVVTSGTYQRKIEKNGEIYHHILDAKTGFSAKTDLKSATIIGKSSFSCDALSTVCILMGSAKGKALVDSLEDYSAVLIKNDGEIIYSD